MFAHVAFDLGFNTGFNTAITMVLNKLDKHEMDYSGDYDIKADIIKESKLYTKVK